jgi:hypothetical protein
VCVFVDADLPDAEEDEVGSDADVFGTPLSYQFIISNSMHLASQYHFLSMRFFFLKKI